MPISYTKKLTCTKKKETAREYNHFEMTLTIRKQQTIDLIPIRRENYSNSLPAKFDSKSAKQKCFAEVAVANDPSLHSRINATADDVTSVCSCICIH